MNKRAARILILFLVFAASVGVFTHLMSHETTENATDLDAASLPVLYMKTADMTVNRMYGYRQEMNGVTTRENLTPLPMDRSLTLEIDAKGQKIKNVTYTVESTDGGALIENSVLKSFDEDGSYLKADFQLETAILMNQEYTLKLEVGYGDGQSAWYYTRIVQRNGVEVGDYLAYTQMFAQTCLDKTQAEALVPQLEPDETGDNSSFLNVNIHSSLDQISWGSLAPTIVQQPVKQIKEANETTTSITQEYMISAQDENGQTEYYTVSEFYRMRESDGEIILLDFERSAQQIFDPELGVLTKSGINLGVTGEDTEYVTNTAGDIVAFVVNGDLWCYNRSANKTIRVFSFRENGSMDEREQHGEHDVNIVRVDDAGDVTFVVYGYMNRGNHEGEVGAAVYYYRAERNVATEEIFVPADISYEMLKKQLDRLSYVNKQREMYLYLNENLCKVDIETGTTTVVRESIPEDCFVVSESQESIAWMDADNASSAMNITVMNLESGETQRFAADDGQKIRALGFINEDFVYGMANDSDILKDISGNEVFAMHTVRIVSIDGNVKKEYHQDGYYVTGVSISDGLLELDRVVRQENGYADAPEDHIMNGEQQSQELVTGRLATVDDRREQQFLLEFSTSGKTQSLLTLTPKYIYSTLRTDLTMSYDTGSADLYYVYGKGKLIAILSSPAEAVQLADENVGVVLNSSQSYVWERGNRQQGMRLDETTMPSGFQSASLDENVLKESLGDDYELLNLTGCTREEILYMISSGYGVVVKTGENESLLLTGYDIFGNSWLYNPATGETTALSDDDSDALFAQYGNVFISYIKKVKIE